MPRFLEVRWVGKISFSTACDSMGVCETRVYFGYHPDVDTKGLCNNKIHTFLHTLNIPVEQGVEPGDVSNRRIPWSCPGLWIAGNVLIHPGQPKLSVH